MVTTTTDLYVPTAEWGQTNMSYPGLVQRPPASSTGFHRFPTWIVFLFWLGMTPLVVQAQLLPHDTYSPDPDQLQYLNRSQALLQSATPSNRVAFRIMFYGNSHFLRPWWSDMVQYIQATYPHVVVIATNASINGFFAVDMSRTVIADVGQWQPDLLLIRAIGPTEDQEALYKNIRAVTTADVIVQAEHPITPPELTESADDSRLLVEFARNYLWYPPIANQYNICWADIRTPWKEYLNRYSLPFNSLLIGDNSHFNWEGNAFAAELMSAFVRPRPLPTGLDPWNNSWIATVNLHPVTNWSGDDLEMDASCSRLDVVYDPDVPGEVPALTVEIDGQLPSKTQDFWGFTRAGPSFEIPWPGLRRVTSEVLLTWEEWTLRVMSFNPSDFSLSYSISGTVTGPDGAGQSGLPFLSNSRRVSVEAADMIIGDAAKWRGLNPPAGFEIKWHSALFANDTLSESTPVFPGGDNNQRMFYSEKDIQRRVRLKRIVGAKNRIRAIRAYSPSGNAQITIRTSSPNVIPVEPPKLFATLVAGAVHLSWPPEYPKGAILVATDISQDGQPIHWQKLAEVPVLKSNRWQVVHNPSENRTFYRWSAE